MRPINGSSLHLTQTELDRLNIDVRAPLKRSSESYSSPGYSSDADQAQGMKERMRLDYILIF
jgi:hypothetical protein